MLRWLWRKGVRIGTELWEAWRGEAYYRYSALVLATGAGLVAFDDLILQIVIELCVKLKLISDIDVGWFDSIYPLVIGTLLILASFVLFFRGLRNAFKSDLDGLVGMLSAIGDAFQRDEIRPPGFYAQELFEIRQKARKVFRRCPSHFSLKADPVLTKLRNLNVDASAQKPVFDVSVDDLFRFRDRLKEYINDHEN